MIVYWNLEEIHRQIAELHILKTIAEIKPDINCYVETAVKKGQSNIGKYPIPARMGVTHSPGRRIVKL